jgi:hypothetical protein
VLLSGSDERRRDQVVLVWQRYGRGKAIAQTVQDSWLWQMHASMSIEDQTHENYWRQMLRWLVDDVPDRVEVHTITDRVEPGDTVTLVADVVDESLRRPRQRVRERTECAGGRDPGAVVR